MKKIIGDYFRKNPLLSPRGYQVETIEESLSLFTEKNFDALLIESPTGAGKTVMGIITAAILAKELGKSRIGWVAMRRNLLSQAMEAAEAFGLGELFHPISMFDKNPPLVDIVVVDEAHHDATVSMASMHKRIQPVKTLGLSATPMRTDRAELIFERTISKAGIYELVRQGFLARPDQYVISDWQVESVCSTFLAEPEKWGKSILFFFTMEECERARSILTASGVQVAIVHAGSDRERLCEISRH